MSELDPLYIQILGYGLIALRNSARYGDLEHCRIESEHLHEIPSYIGCENVNAHLFYARVFRRVYLEWASNNPRDNVRQLLEFYASPWAEMDRILGLEGRGGD